MSVDHGTTPSPAWHEALRDRDEQAHRREDEWMSRQAVEVLEARLAQANADRHALRAAIGLRDHLLNEQRLAVQERDERIRALDEQLHALVRLGSQPLWRRAARRGRRMLGRLRRLLP